MIWSHAWARASIVAVGSFGVAWVFEVAIIGVLSRLAARTKTNLDDLILDLLRRPIYVSLLLIGLSWSAREVEPPAPLLHTIKALLFSIAIVLWSFTLLRIGALLLKEVAKRGKEGSVLQARTLPLFDIVIKTSVLAGAIYLGMVAWDIDVGAWLASAGIVGVAVGFAARDSLANYFAGVFIIADAPYRLGDVITLDDGTRGKITDIGLRSTRIHTKDDIEINIPNSILGNMKIENRSAGPTSEERISLPIGVAYGSDVDRVIEVLHSCTEGVGALARHRTPQVYFVGFGDSSLDFELKVWVEDPGAVELVRHEINMRIYKALASARIEIPFPQTDVHIKDTPDSERKEEAA